MINLHCLEEKPLFQRNNRSLHSNGFYPVVDIQDFPRKLALEVKRRRWIDIDTREVFSRDWNLVAKNTHTSEFALFKRDLLDSIPVSCKSLSTYYHVNGKRLEEQYRNHLSDFLTWNQLDHADQWLLFKQNIGSHLSIEKCCSRRTLYSYYNKHENKEV